MSESDGEVSEWSKVLDSKSSVPQGTEGSNPSLSAMLSISSHRNVAAFYFEVIKFVYDDHNFAEREMALKVKF